MKPYSILPLLTLLSLPLPASGDWEAERNEVLRSANTHRLEMERQATESRYERGLPSVPVNASRYLEPTRILPNDPLSPAYIIDPATNQPFRVQ